MTKTPTLRLGTVSKGPKSYAKLKSISSLLDIDFGPSFVWNAPDIKDRLYKLNRWRRTRLSQLAAEGWTKLRREWERVAGCPPSGAHVEPTLRECRVDYFCPFCWVRHITAEVYNRFAWGIYNTNQLQFSPAPIRTLDTVLFRRQAIISLARYENPKDIFFAARETASTVCKQLQPIALGSYSLVTLQPAADFEDQALLTENIMSLVMPGAEVLDIVAPHKFSTQRLYFNQLSPYALAEYVGMACEYPAGFMTGSLKLTHKIIKIRSRKRKGGQRTPNASEFWGYLKQFHVYRFDQKCHTAYQENYTNATKPHSSAALGGITS
jgi:hypothetical protein